MRFNKQILEAVERGLLRGLNLSINDFDVDYENDDLPIYLDGIIKKQIRQDSHLDYIFSVLYNLAVNLLFTKEALERAYLLKQYSLKYVVKNCKTLKNIILEVSTIYPEADLNWIDVSNIKSMSNVFLNSQFNGDISGWNMSNVLNMSYMFKKSKFDGDISKWDVSKVNCMDGIFYGSKFKGDISNWDVSKVTSMNSAFGGSKFNGDISKWDVSSVEDMRDMFYFAHFNGDISKWDISSVKDMRYMFSFSQFNGDISKWDISIDCDTNRMFFSCKIKEEYKPKRLLRK